MTRSTHTIQRLAAAAALALALAVLTVPAAPAAGCPCNSDLLPAGRGQAASQKAPNASQVTDDGTLLSRASRHATQLQQLVKTNSGRVTDGTLLSRASRQPALELAKINPGHVTDGMLLTKSALLYELAQIDPGHGAGKSIVSEAAAARAPTAGPVGHNGFDWGDAGTGFGVAAFAAALLAGAAFTVRRRGTLIHLP